MDKTYLVTPTGYRHKQFALCEKWVSRFPEFENLTWLVVDDTAEPVTCTKGQVLIRRHNMFKGATLGLNITEAIKHTGKSANIIIIEDDVWYSPYYVSMILEMFKRAELVGFAPAFVYNVEKKCYRIFKSKAHASFSETATRGKATEQLARLSRVCTTMLDMAIWTRGTARRSWKPTEYLAQLHKPVAVSMKGHGQKRTLGSFHKETPDFIADPELIKLREWIGNDVEDYYPNPLSRAETLV